MNAERLTTKSRDVITGAVADANQRGHATVEPWHLLLSLLDTGGSTASALLRAVGANPADVRRAAVRAVEQLPSARGASIAEPSLSREFVNAIGEAELIAKPLGDEYVSTEHLLAGLARVGGAVGKALRDVGATEETLVAAFPAVRGGDRRVTTAEPGADLPGAGEVQRRPDRAGPRRQDRPGDRPGRRDPPGRSRCCPGVPRTTRS